LSCSTSLEVLSLEVLKVDFFTKDTNCLVFILSRLPFVEPNTQIITGIGRNQRKVALKPIYDKLGAEIATC
jgi:hypothetical protein